MVAIYSTFLQRGFDQIIHDVCLESLPVVFALDRGGLVGEDGPTHHGVFDLSYLRMIPNMTLMAPKDENELAQMLKTAITMDGPCAIRYPRGEGLGVTVETPPRTVPVGKAEILTQGDDLLILAVGRGVTEALAAETLLREKAIQSTVVNMRFVKPLDHDVNSRFGQKNPPDHHSRGKCSGRWIWNGSYGIVSRSRFTIQRLLNESVLPTRLCSMARPTNSVNATKSMPTRWSKRRRNY